MAGVRAGGADTALEVESDDREELREPALDENAALHVEHDVGPGRIDISWTW